MSTELALYWTQETLRITVLLAGPLLLGSLVIGLVISILQAVTSVQEMTLTYVPKMLIIAVLLLLLAPWLLNLMIDFTARILLSIPGISR
ncbi:MAG: flagellar biosynthesis protein FliQ [Bacteroidetes bacterium]|nr:flagellar biosynthesis protein FliQ [Rhodothermia bacterium]MCS7154428.1 flagellar biosynthesis protein FliQ [Bacteroidota bacterium]MCX7906801.1 flagellar biosynthesis protein FliQ [Bacteroidota bacterium]MDW8136920.1 flagellar biosynthesis protein FliQ [Bacteroidota bacterium]MDW8285210.1 flagellar biosynthesis protein FliQ [Bacteroidota bacterium]